MNANKPDTNPQNPNQSNFDKGNFDKGSEKLRNIKEGFSNDNRSPEQMMNTAKDRVRDAASRVSGIASDVLERGREYSHTIDQRVHETPWPFIGGVAVGSLLLGFILGRRS